MDRPALPADIVFHRFAVIKITGQSCYFALTCIHFLYKINFFSFEIMLASLDGELCGRLPTHLLTCAQSKWHHAQKASEHWDDTKPHCRHLPHYENRPPAGSQHLLTSLTGNPK